MSKKLQLLRNLMKNGSLTNGKIVNVYLLPRTDPHKSEYISDRYQRVKFISGFSGSNAMVLVTNSKALCWTDGRYFDQAIEEFEEGWELMKQAVPDSITPLEWIDLNIPSGSVIAFDSHLVSQETAITMKNKLEALKIELLPIEKNFVDEIWENRPEEEIKKIKLLGVEYAGEDVPSKIERLRDTIREKKCDSIILTLLDDIAWLFNIRGNDIEYNPVVFSYALITMDESYLFINKKKLPEGYEEHLKGVKIFDYEKISDILKEYHSKNKENISHKMWVPSTTNYGLSSLISEGNTYASLSPVQVLKAIKNETELNGMRQAHIRDSGAVIEFLIWLEEELKSGKTLSEKIAMNKLDSLRSTKDKFVSLSFDTISAVNEHAALPHYKMTEKSNLPLKFGDVYLVDSGGQYFDGTTDVTRTVIVGDNINNEFIDLFTQVLIGHIECAMAKFPEGIIGCRLDSFARHSLWDNGYDFGHGTGHSFGSFLNVHEGPGSISFRNPQENGQLKAGQMMTIEPGYYRTSHWGIRIENCYEIIKCNVNSGASNFLTFSPLTLVPIQKKLINKNMLSSKQVNWLNDYHSMVYDIMTSYFKRQCQEKEISWLKEACAPL
ncbi:Xaa-Pro aminopeptidase 1 [Strongyloides ratti]|uniref:Xaa-Pro aminopeptidase 1 n=1 Tax=Strongyloides ratti TaxID=34506 RepID=A0A090LCU0_STRRB|nr:Xaa-Pro aminopeptidase 1 [Strongyloides ratti]CEF65943.1 Xaa-Pro aminopeptidase 1 [Strongyloides ratti]